MIKTKVPQRVLVGYITACAGTGLVDAVQSFHCLFKILSGPINGQYRRCLWRSKRLHRQAQRGSERKQVCKRLHIHVGVSQEQDGLSFGNQVRNQESTLTKLPFGRFGPSVGVVHGDLLPFIFRRGHLYFFHQSYDRLGTRLAAVLRREMSFSHQARTSASTQRTAERREDPKRTGSGKSGCA